MRIGVVGSAGTGKTTLAKALSKALGVSLVPDFVPIVLREHGKDSWKQVHDWRTSRVLRLSALERKIAAEQGHAAFVSDRTVLDYLAYWLHNQSEHETAEQNAAFLTIVKEHAGRYDRCVFLPWRPTIDGGGYRSVDPMHNLKIASMKRGLLAVMGVPVVEATYTFGEDIEAWIARNVAPPSSPAIAAVSVLAESALSSSSAPAAGSSALVGGPGAPGGQAALPAPEFDEAALVQRIVEQACRALADRQEPETRQDDGEVWKLDRRVEKLAKALSDTEERLRGMIAAKAVDTGIPSVFRGVQGLSAETPGYEKKRALLSEILTQNVELRTRITSRKGQAFPTRSSAALVSEVAPAPAAPEHAAPDPAAEAASLAGAVAPAALVDSAQIDFEEKAF